MPKSEENTAGTPPNSHIKANGLMVNGEGNHRRYKSKKLTAKHRKELPPEVEAEKKTNSKITAKNTTGGRSREKKLPARHRPKTPPEVEAEK